MEFNSDSMVLMNFMMKNFKLFYKKKTPEQQEKADNVLKEIYKQIKRSDTEVKNLKKKLHIQRIIKEGGNVYELSQNELFDSHFIPDSIKDIIQKEIKGQIKYNCNFQGCRLTFTFYLMNENDFKNLKDIEILFTRLLTAYLFLSKHANKKYNKTLDVKIFLTDIKKKLPLSQFKILSPIHANTAVTKRCLENGKIIIFRKEEVFKVFIHECMHSLCLDWYEMNLSPLKIKLKEMFKINSNINTPEAYVEFWASILNCCFTSYFINSTNLEEYLLFSEYCIQFEQLFSLFQMVKILKFMGIHYRSLYETDKLSIQSQKYLYRENTNIFAYFILKTIIQYNAFNFIFLCKKMNSNFLNMKVTENSMNKLFEFINKNYNKPAFLEDITKMYQMLKRMPKKDKETINRTMRMTIIELN